MIIDNCYKLYDKTIKDFCNDILIKNNITDPFDIFWLFCEFYKNNYFSKETTKKSFFITSHDDSIPVDKSYQIRKTNEKEEYQDTTYNDIGDKLSEYMTGTDYKKEYLGMFMVNGDGTCKHINCMLRDIYKYLGYKAYLMSGNVYNCYGSLQYRKNSRGKDVAKTHTICSIEYENKMVYLDAMYRCIPLELEKENENTAEILSNRYIIKGLKNYYHKKIELKERFFESSQEIKEYLKNDKDTKEMIDNIRNQCIDFRNNHLDYYEYISRVLHLHCDNKHFIINLKFHQKAFEILKKQNNNIKTLKK